MSSYLILAICVILPCLATHILYKNQNLIEKESIKLKFGSFYEKLRTNNSLALMKSGLFFLRRFLHASVLVLLAGVPAI